MLHDVLIERIYAFETLGHPMLMERFILRNGKTYAPRSRIGRKRQAKQCFANSTRFVLDNGGSYVEGYTLGMGLPIHHAWVTMNGNDAMDPTLEASTHEYFGVEFGKALLQRELLRKETYGLLDDGIFLNARLMFELDPELKTIVEAVKKEKRRIA